MSVSDLNPVCKLQHCGYSASLCSSHVITVYWPNGDQQLCWFTHTLQLFSNQKSKKYFHKPFPPRPLRRTPALPKTFTMLGKHAHTPMHKHKPPHFSHGTLKLMAGSFKRIIRCSEWAIMRIRLIYRRQAIRLSDRYKHPHKPISS